MHRADRSLTAQASDGVLLASIARGRNARARNLLLRLLPDAIVVSWLIWLFDAINNLAPVRQGLAERDGESVLSLEHRLHLDPEHALNRWTADHNTVSQIAVFWYENVHIVVTLVVFAWLWWRRADLLRSMRATLILVNLIALAVFWSFPVAPPRMLSGGYVDLVAAVHHLPTWQLGAIALHSNQLCSMPSLHVAWATWSSLALWRMSRRWWLRALAVVYPLLTSFAVMATANHYLVDALAGAAITLLVQLLLEQRSLVKQLVGGTMRTTGKTTS
jgi:membrane-associated phospholipid phosphatase